MPAENNNTFGEAHFFKPSFTSVILAGGKAVRMDGLAKTLIKIEGQSILERMAKVIFSIFDEVILVANEYKEEYENFNFSAIVQDVYKNKGPLGGIHAGMKSASCDYVFVFAADLPFLNSELILQEIKMLKKEDEALIPEHEKGIEPLHAIYKTTCISLIEKILENNTNAAIRELLPFISTHYWKTVPDIAFTNINNKIDLLKWSK